MATQNYTMIYRLLTPFSRLLYIPQDFHVCLNFLRASVVLSQCVACFPFLVRVCVCVWKCVCFCTCECVWENICVRELIVKNVRFLTMRLGIESQHRRFVEVKIRGGDTCKALEKNYDGLTKALSAKLCRPNCPENVDGGTNTSHCDWGYERSLIVQTADQAISYVSPPTRNNIRSV